MDNSSFAQSFASHLWLFPAAMAVIHVIRLFLASKIYTKSPSTAQKTVVLSERKKVVLWMITTVFVALIIYWARPYLST